MTKSHTYHIARELKGVYRLGHSKQDSLIQVIEDIYFLRRIPNFHECAENIRIFTSVFSSRDEIDLYLMKYIWYSRPQKSNLKYPLYILVKSSNRPLLKV